MVLTCACGLAMLTWAVPDRSTRRRGPNLDLQVNLRHELDVAPGTPLTFDVFVTGGRAFPRTRIGNGLRSWNDSIRLELSNGAVVPWTLDEISVRSADVTREAGGQLQIDEGQTRVALLDGSRYLHVFSLGVGPEVTTSAGAGEFQVRAVLETPWWAFTGWRGRVASRAVTITVRPVDGADPRGRAREEERIALSASYWLRKGRFEDARTFARQLVALRPAVAESHVVLGDVLLALKEPQAALNEYRTALRLVEPSYEPPVLLTKRMTDAARRIGK